jgi:predicted acyltransferase
MSASAKTYIPQPKPPPERLMSLDAYRGFIMLMMASHAFGFPVINRELKGSHPLWAFLGYQFDHVPWVGCAFWDLIQPSFMFMVGVAVPYSLAARKEKGDSDGEIFFHALWRSLVLILLAVILSSPISIPSDTGTVTGPTTNWIFTNVLAQIGLGYIFVVLLSDRGIFVQWFAIGAILAGYTVWFMSYPAPSADHDWASVGVPATWEHLTGSFAHWDKNSNAAHAFDVWFLNLFPRAVPFFFNTGGYQTLNFIPSMATMLLGLMAGEMLRDDRRSRVQKWAMLMWAGLGCLIVGTIMGMTICPIVKRIWTPSWAIFSAGWTFLMLGVFYGLIDVRGYRGWAFPFVVVGMNSIGIYLMAQHTMWSWIQTNLKVHLGSSWFAFSPSWVIGPFLHSLASLLVLWLICFWMYRRKIFLKI